MTQVGDIVELVHCGDPYTHLEPGLRGMVTLIDDTGTVHVRWDNDSTLGLVAEAGDRWRVVQERKTPVINPSDVYPPGRRAGD